MLDWIFEGIATWVASVMTQIMDAISGVFIGALGTDMTAMEEYFPFITKAFDVMKYTAWAILFLIIVWQLFRAFGGPITEAENPWQLVVRGAVFALLIGYAKPIFTLALDIARAPYTALMDLSMTAEDFTAHGCQFFVIGTNDLTQYTHAVSRELAIAEHYYRPASPAMKKLIAMVVDAARKADIPVTICGLAVGNAVNATQYLRLGLRSFSMSPQNLLTIKKALRDADAE